MHIGIYGGTFDPPHIGHVLAVSWVLSITDVDFLWVVPTFRHPFGKASVGYKDRLTMCRIAFADLERVVVSEVESEIDGAGYTVELLAELTRRFPDAKQSLVIGEDLVNEVPTWHDAAKLPKVEDMIVVGRGGCGTTGDGRIRMPDVSSRDIRARLGRNETVDGLVPKRVARWIAERRLYRGP